MRFVGAPVNVPGIALRGGQGSGQHGAQGGGLAVAGCACASVRQRVAGGARRECGKLFAASSERPASELLCYPCNTTVAFRPRFPSTESTARHHAVLHEHLRNQRR